MIEPPVLVRVAVPLTAWMLSLPWKYIAVEPAAKVAPPARLRLLLTITLPLPEKPKLGRVALPMVTPSRLPLLIASVLVSPLTRIAFFNVPLNAFSPALSATPLPNDPVPPMSSCAPAMSSVPVRFTVPPLRVKRPALITAGANVAPMLRVPPCNAMLPLLVHACVAAGLIVTVAPLTTMLPALANGVATVLLGDMLSVPAVALITPPAALVNEVVLMVKVCPVVLALMVPLLTTVPAL